MEYFLISQDGRYRNPPVIDAFYTQFRHDDFTLMNCKKIQSSNVTFASSMKPFDRMDFLSNQICLVSEPVKKVFSLYDRSISYKIFFLLNNLTGDSLLYYAPIIFQLDCIYKRNPLQNAKEKPPGVILDKDKLGDFSIFKISCAVSEGIVARLDLAESLLRRNVRGIRFKRLEVM